MNERTHALGRRTNPGEGTMRLRHFVSLAIAAIGLPTVALAADQKPMNDMAMPATAASDAGMGGMAMKMTLPPMPAIYGGEADKPGAPMFTGYGNHHHQITTSNPQTQAYFDQGVRLLFAFNHAE